MKILFLDIDGVLNNEVILKNAPHCEVLDATNVQQLNHIIAQTGAKVVVSSAWRQGRTIKQLQEVLEHDGFVGEVIGKTPRLLAGVRGDEIMSWIETGTAQYGVDVESLQPSLVEGHVLDPHCVTC